MLLGKSTPAILAIIYLKLNLFYKKLLSLAHLELGVLLADDIETAFASDDLAIIAALLDGCFDFHIACYFYLYLKDILPLVKS